eukprot:GHVL01020689.1.p1 GENE.GHVL01020689.1~~GHVL01020689.1.p1  ORF type:complete len:205 (+),score=32.61 GHVL01020689.1:53-667(+)
MSSIHHCLISRKCYVLAEYSTSDSTESSLDVAKESLSESYTGTHRFCLHARFTYVYIYEKDLIYVCVADKLAGTEIPYQFIQEVCQKHINAPVRDTNSVTLMIKSIMDKYNTTQSRIRSVEDDLYDVKEILKENIDKVMSRGSQLDTLVDKTENMKQGLIRYRVAVTKQPNRKIFFLIGLITILLLVTTIYYGWSPSRDDSFIE